MAYFRQLDDEMTHLLSLFERGDKWLIIINADPDALASAMALKRIMSRRVESCEIASINEVKRPRQPGDDSLFANPFVVL